jgi:hypothetical protein
MRAGDGGGKPRVCGFCGKPEKEVRAMIAGPSVSICDECVDVLGEVVGRYREDAGITRTVRVRPGHTLPAAVLLAGVHDFLRAERPGARASVSVGIDGDEMRLDVRPAPETRAKVTAALADYGLIVTGTAPARAAEARVLDAARAAFAETPADAAAATARRVSVLLSNGGMLLGEIRRRSSRATDARVRDALAAIGEALEQGFDARAEEAMRAQIATLARVDPEALARIREVAVQSEATGGGALLAAWIAR